MEPVPGHDNLLTHTMISISKISISALQTHILNGISFRTCGIGALLASCNVVHIVSLHAPDALRCGWTVFQTVQIHVLLPYAHP